MYLYLPTHKNLSRRMANKQYFNLGLLGIIAGIFPQVSGKDPPEI